MDLESVCCSTVFYSSEFCPRRPFNEGNIHYLSRVNDRNQNCYNTIIARHSNFYICNTNMSEAACKLQLELSWQKLCQNGLDQLFKFPDSFQECIADGDLNELNLMVELIKDSTNAQEQLVGLLNLLLEALQKSNKPQKYTRFCQVLQRRQLNHALISFSPGCREQAFFNYLAAFCNSNSLINDGLIACLLSNGSFTEADMALIQSGACGSDAALLSALIAKTDWPQRLVIGLVQANLMGQLEILLPGFQQLVADNFDRGLPDLVGDLTSPPDCGFVRHAARNVLGEALDLYICLNSPSIAEPSPAISATAAAASGASTYAANKDRQRQENGDKDSDHSSGCRTPPKQMRLELEEAGRDSPSGDDAITDEVKQQMREYQSELAAPGVSGQNSVIVAPTGSGKTLVAIKIAAARLTEGPGVRVAFLADRKHLVEQQFAAFKEQLQDRFRDRIICLTGGDNDRAPLSYCLKDNSVLILSTQILLNSLRDKSEDGLNGDVGKFSLIIFDECHHCAKDHPSNKIMEFYFQFKSQHPDRRPPQIVGLTASPGTGGATRTQDAVQHVLRLCASLDCRSLVTVKRCGGSLAEHATSSSFRLHHADRKLRDPVAECLDALMDLAEEGLDAVCRERRINLPQPPQDRGSFLYTNFCGDLKAKAARACAAANSGTVEVITAWRFLHHCNVAILLWGLFRSTDSAAYVREQLVDCCNITHKAPTCHLDSALRECLRAQQLPRMSAFCRDHPDEANNSPSLAVLTAILNEQFSKNADSRVLVFVQQRCFASAVRDFLETRAPELAAAGVRVGVITGNNASADSGGTTQTDQQDVLASFRRGRVKILISTSVTEEGLDVQKCNAVVRFCHVTNEIAMVQSRGRGRAEGSGYHVIVPDEMHWLGRKERINQARDAMMTEAVTRLGNLPQEEFVAQVLTVQREQLEAAAARRCITAAAAAANRCSQYDVTCLCDQPLTGSDRLRLAQGCHRLALDADMLRQRLEPKRESSPKEFADYSVLGVGLMCRKCGYRVGSLCRYKGLAFPEIAIQSVKFVSRRDPGVTHGPLKKWKLAAKFLTEVEIGTADLLEWAKDVPDIPEQLLTTEMGDG